MENQLSNVTNYSVNKTKKIPGEKSLWGIIQRYVEQILLHQTKMFPFGRDQ